MQRAKVYSRVVQFGIIILLGWSVGCTSPEQRAAKLVSKAQAVWHMDEEAGDMVIDAQAKYSATSYNTQIVSGHLKKARYFNGTDSYIKTPLNFSGWTSVTISFWVNPEPKEAKDMVIILDNGHDAESNFVVQSPDNTEKTFVLYCAGGNVFFSLSSGSWSYVAIIIDLNSKKLLAYLNGNKVGEAYIPAAPKFGSTPLTFGKHAITNFRYFNGAIDEVAVWDRVLSENEIETLSMIK